MAKIRKSIGKVTVAITAPNYGEAIDIGNELDTYKDGDTPKDRIEKVWGEKYFPKLK